MGKQFKVVLGMRYGNPSIEQAIDDLKECETITVLNGGTVSSYDYDDFANAIEKMRLEISVLQRDLSRIDLQSRCTYRSYQSNKYVASVARATSIS